MTAPVSLSIADVVERAADLLEDGGQGLPVYEAVLAARRLLADEVPGAAIPAAYRVRWAIKGAFNTVSLVGWEAGRAPVEIVAALREIVASLRRARA